MLTEEEKQMVDAFHEAGIDVYLEMMFGTECSQSYMLDCLRHWVRCYGIDGFLFYQYLWLQEMLIYNRPYS